MIPVNDQYSSSKQYVSYSKVKAMIYVVAIEYPLLHFILPKIKKIRGRENIAVGTWNVRTLRPAGKLEQLTHAMSRYHWNIVGLCEMRWKNFGEMSTDDGHKVYFSGEEGKHEYGVGFLVHKDVVGAVLGCRPVSSRLISIRLRAAPFNITIIQVYAPTSYSGHDAMRSTTSTSNSRKS